jgi:hypothetical protein
MPLAVVHVTCTTLRTTRKRTLPTSPTQASQSALHIHSNNFGIDLVPSRSTEDYRVTPFRDRSMRRLASRRARTSQPMPDLRLSALCRRRRGEGTLPAFYTTFKMARSPSSASFHLLILAPLSPEILQIFASLHLSPAKQIPRFATHEPFLGYDHDPPLLLHHCQLLLRHIGPFMKSISVALQSLRAVQTTGLFSKVV